MQYPSFRSLLGLALSAFLAACLFDSQAKGGHVVENEVLAGTLYAENGEPAAGARVKAYSVLFVPRDGLAKSSADTGLVYTGVTDAKGRYVIDSLAPGVYNFSGESKGALSFLDSFTVDPKTTDIPADTLRAPGSLTLFTVLEPNHDRRKVFLQVLGTDRFATADSSGKIVLHDIARGQYNFRVAASQAGYIPFFGNVAIQAGKETVYGETVRLVYTDIPIVKELKSAYDTSKGAATLSWRKTAYGNLMEYIIYRSKASDLVPPLTPIAKTQDTVFLDSLDAGEIGDVPQEYEYRVRIRNKSEETGPVFGSTVVAIAPQSMVRTAFGFDLGEDNPLMRVGINDSVAISLRWSNPSRGIQSLQWFSADGTPLSGLFPVHGKEGRDTLRTRLPSQAGPWSVLVRAIDEAGETWKAGLTLNVQLGAPTAFAGKDTLVSVNDRVLLHGVGTDSLGRIVKREWNIGPGGDFVETGIGDTSILAGSVSGVEHYVFRVTDDDGNSAQATLNVQVLLDPPKAFAGADTVVTISDTVLLVGSGVDALGSIRKYEWDFGNTGTFTETVSGKVSILAPAVPGISTNVFRVTDEDGNTANDTMRISTGDDFPQLAFDYLDRPDWEGGGYTLVAKAKDKGRIKWEWDIGETGTYVPGSREDTSFIPSQSAGTVLPCRVRVSDDDGNQVIAKLEIYISKWSVVSPIPDRNQGGHICAHKGILYIESSAGTRTYDPALNKWGKLAEKAPASLMVSNGNRLFALGLGESRKTVLYAFDETFGTWSLIYTSEISRRYYFNAIAIGDRIFLKSGGFPDGSDPSVIALEPLEEINLAGGVHSTFPPENSIGKGRYSQMATMGGKVYIANENTWSEYDPDLKSWKDLESSDPTDKLSLTSSVGLGGKIYLISAYSSNWAYDVAQAKWQRISQVRYPISRSTTVMGGKIYAVGSYILQSYDPKDEP